MSDIFIRYLVIVLRLKVEYIWKSPKTWTDLTFLDTQLDFLPHIYMGSKGGIELSSGIWGDYREVSWSKTITWFWHEFSVKFVIFIFFWPNFELEKIDFFQRYENLHEMVSCNELLFQEAQNRPKALISDEISWFRPLPAKWVNVEKCEFTLFLSN